MKKSVELPLVSPIYGTYQVQGVGSAVICDNPSIKNWYLNQTIIPYCSRRFLSGFSSPELDIVNSHWKLNPYLDKNFYGMEFLGGYVNPLIHNLLDAGYYVYFVDVDDYYIEGKTWYKERHFSHDGMICGYNRDDKTYCMYAYDSNWVYNKFWTPKSSFEKARKAMFEKGVYGKIYGIKPKKDKAEFSPETAMGKISEYLDSTIEKYPWDGEGIVYGIAVYDYIEKYIEKLSCGAIPYESIDRRVFRLLWEHKKLMLEVTERIEENFDINPDISKKYRKLVGDANNMRMLYASHCIKRRDSVLPIIGKSLLLSKENEKRLLGELIEKTGGKNK